MSKFFKVMALSLSLVMALSFTGCGKKAAPGAVDSSQAKLGTSYPLDTDETLKYWLQINENITASVSEFGETEFAKKAAELSGVKVEYISPAIGQGTEQFNLMLASGDLPDIVEYGWFEFPGGPAKAIKDGYIIPLNDAFAAYAPNLTAFLKEHPEDADKMIKTDEGVYYLFPMVRDGEKLLITAGMIVRQDLLDKYGIKDPETYDEWYDMLVTFKNNGIEIPLAFNATNTYEIESLFRTFGSPTGYYRDGDTVKYAPFEPEFKETLTRLTKWYSEGLIDKNFTTTDSKIREANMLSGKIGVTYGSGGGQLGKWIQALPKDSEIKLGTLTYPTERADEIGSKHKSITWPYSGSGSAITTACKNIELAAKYLDFFYSEEGHMLANFGIEGESYTMVDGQPKYTEKITNNPDGLSMSQAMAMYMRSYSAGTMIQDERYIEQYYALPEQQQALVDWAEEVKYTDSFLLPRVLPTAEEASEMAEIKNNADTYRDNMILKFITGIEPLENFDKFVEQLKAYNVERGIEINQAAYDRYLAR
ncbi:MAG: extracellular solute-binding protein [Clostridia bacterium]|nr:extracellular solute-binding protein [Clostridia bacterium]